MITISVGESMNKLHRFICFFLSGEKTRDYLMLKGKKKKKLESVITCSYFNKKMYIIIILYYYFRYNLDFGVF